MIKQVFKTMVAFLAVATMTIGPVRGQNANPDVILDFTTNDWGLPTTGNNHGPESYSNGTYSITLSATTSYKLNSGYLLLGKSGSYLELPEFESAVDSIVVVGNSAASDQVKQNIYVGATAVSTQTTGAKGTNTYVINENFRAAGNIYTLMVESAQNTQITYIKVYYVSSGGGSGSQTTTTYNVTFGGFNVPEMNTTVNVASLPQTFTAVGGNGFYPFTVISGNGSVFTSASVTSGGNGKVSVNMTSPSQMTITVSGTFEGTATIHVAGEDYIENPISRDITVSCVVASEPEPEPSVPHTVRFASGNDGWTVTDVDSARSATAPTVLQNVMAGDSLVVTAPATLPGKVKSVKAVKYVAPAATVTTAPTATAGIIEAGSATALVNAGVANGGTMMYAVTTTNVQPASTADFSATRPTAEGRAAGTYYVWFYAKADADHSDSEIAGPVPVTLAVMTTVTWNSTNVFNSDHWQDAIGAWQSGSLTYETITISKPTTGNSAFYPYDLPEQRGRLVCYGDDDNHDSFTFTAPQGMKFCKIEIINNEGITFDEYGDWTEGENNNIVWSGTAANAVTLGTVYTAAGNLNSIVFKLIDD